MGDEKMIGKNEFRCALCGGVFEKGWSEEEALAELRQRWPGIDLSACVTVCDACHGGIENLPRTH